MSLIDFFSRHGAEILQATLEHVWLVGATMLLSIAIGVPLGILVARRPWLSKPILGSANIAETIPSLALLGFFLTVPWLGERADRLTIAALTLYALLPIIRNTATGIAGVDPAVREAARGMGMTDAANSVSRGTAALRLHHARRHSRGNRAHDRHRHHRGSCGSRRPRRVYFSRPRDGEQSVDSCRSGSGSFARACSRISCWACWNAGCGPRDEVQVKIFPLDSAGRRRSAHCRHNRPAFRLHDAAERHDRGRIEEFPRASAARRNSCPASRSAHSSARRAAFLSCG